MFDTPAARASFFRRTDTATKARFDDVIKEYKFTEAKSSDASKALPLLGVHAELRPEDDYENIYVYMRQVIHNWLQTQPQDIQSILTFDDRMKICKTECSPPVLGREINEILKDDVLSTTRSISDIPNISPNALLEENEEAHDQLSLIWEQDTSVSVRVAPTVVFDPYPKKAPLITSLWKMSTA
ncbi:hypothetical protein PNOK_0555600 [Pyrrhoderma noxium]|uniref:Uncharacterized protein n=1 Tax=Pyrrhoderma noxium TaxID=2282107 RepID=A0A286UGJ1_9AGAM|nr:hypothetical protein PNOK_0555600 [Pyrrhoderma noxium]